MDQAQVDVRNLVLQLQDIHPYLPLKVFPSKVVEFPQTSGRINPERKAMVDNQNNVLEVWNNELAKRYSGQELAYPKSQIVLR